MRIIVVEFNSIRSYLEFDNSTKKQNRYIFDNTTKRFLETILETIENRKETIPQGSTLWRSQIGNDWKPIMEGKKHIADIPCPFSSDRMKPLTQMAIEGRANPKGIPYLYLSTKKETAMAEARPWLGSLISLGMFEITRNIELINCFTKENKRNLIIYFEEPNAAEKEKAVWRDIDWAFSKPVSNSDGLADYIPTQILAELFKNNGYDGIAYKSALREGHNVVLFDINIATIKNRFLYETDDIQYKFKEY